MALHVICAGCASGDHGSHDGRGTAPPGMIGGEACFCAGECLLTDEARQRLQDAEDAFERTILGEVVPVAGDLELLAKDD